MTLNFEYLDGVDRNPVGAGFQLIDHLTHNVYTGRMDYWAAFYEAHLPISARSAFSILRANIPALLAAR